MFIQILSNPHNIFFLRVKQNGFKKKTTSISLILVVGRI